MARCVVDGTSIYVGVPIPIGVVPVVGSEEARVGKASAEALELADTL